MSKLKRTSIYDEHKKLGGKLIEFAGWEMPVQYAGVLKEHKTVRSSVGIFDVSHMGEIEVKGEKALEYCQRVTTNDVSKLNIGDVQYSVYCMPSAGIVDDFTLFRMGEKHYMFIVNAANKEKDYKWMLDNKIEGVEIKDSSDEYSLFALQGPVSEDVLAKIFPDNLAGIKFYSFIMSKYKGMEVMISRTGYTGEDGFEIMIKNEGAVGLWNEIMDSGKDKGIAPIGLAARDTLRMEMGYALYGNDINEEINPLLAGLGWIVKMNKGEFIGKEKLAQLKAAGFIQRFTGFKLTERGVPRDKCKIFKNDKEVGWVSSGTYSPSLNVGLGLCYLNKDIKADEDIKIDIRGRKVTAVVQKPPFVKGSIKR